MTKKFTLADLDKMIDETLQPASATPKFADRMRELRRSHPILSKRRHSVLPSTGAYGMENTDKW